MEDAAVAPPRIRSAEARVDSCEVGQLIGPFTDREGPGGGSNSAGTNSLQYNMRSPKNPITYGRRISSFADELMLRLQPTFRLSGRYVGGGMGPTAAAACVSRFAPAETRLATVEFLPNIGYVKDDTGELESIGELLRVLRARGAATYVVDVISGSIRYEREARFQRERCFGL